MTMMKTTLLVMTQTWWIKKALAAENSGMGRCFKQVKHSAFEALSNGGDTNM